MMRPWPLRLSVNRQRQPDDCRTGLQSSIPELTQLEIPRGQPGSPSELTGHHLPYLDATDTITTFARRLVQLAGYEQSSVTAALSCAVKRREVNNGPTATS